MKPGQAIFLAAVQIHYPKISLKIKRFDTEAQLPARHPDNSCTVRGIVRMFIPGHRRVVRQTPRACVYHIHFVDFQRPVLVAGK